MEAIMNKAEKVVWTEGMFLRPHHFQQSESYQLSALRQWGSAQRPGCGGFLDYEIDEGMLQQGKIALSSASGLLPDGTFFSFRDANGAPPPIEIADNQIGEKVVLALPARRNGREEVIFSETADSLARYVSYEQEVDDFNAMSVGAAAVQFGKLRLRLMLESELSAEWTAMAVVSVAEKRSDNQVQLDSSYIPPMLHSIAHSQLDSWLNDIAGLLMQRSQQIGQRLQQPGRFNTADFHLKICRCSILKTLRPLVGFRLRTDHVHAVAYPDALPGLSLVMEENAIQLPLTERSHGLNVATVPTSSMVHDFGFVLAVRANVPGDMLQTHFPAQMKVAPVTKIRDLVQLQLPGMVLRAMPAAPPQIPWHAGYSYFELEKGSELWLEMEKSGTFALHLAGEFPGLTMEFWAVRTTGYSERSFFGASSNNPLVAAANGLLNAIPQIRHSVTHDDPAGLRQRLIDEIRQFEMNCQRASLPYEVIIGARYCLCTALDEAAALTPWGSRGVWPGQGLLVTFHNETWGGEKFFQLLAKLSQNPREQIVLLELINYCLQLGFEGATACWTTRLLQMIRSVRGGYAPPLSPHPEDHPVTRKLWRPVVPLWACTALVGFLACLFYILLNWRLGDATSPVLAANPAPPAPAALNLKAFLRPEIEQGLVVVKDEADRSVVTLKGDGLFTSGSTAVRGRYEEVLDRVAQAMNNVNGRILVIGYSDNVPIRSARFASNYELSLARAQSVQERLQQHLTQPQRVKAEGRGETNPLVPNTTAENRARNRRVDITLLVSPQNTRAEMNLQQGN
ncbi:hypothetical protein L0F63_005374 [Massospora cicadina]|nr:hypothetical protein L0F63_005374 [Massospora cicadina]